MTAANDDDWAMMLADDCLVGSDIVLAVALM